MRKPLMNVKYATDSFNYLNRLNHSVKIAVLNRDQSIAGRKYNNAKKHLGLWMDWKPLCNLYCNPCTPEIVKTKLYNRNPLRDKLKKIFCCPAKYEFKANIVH